MEVERIRKDVLEDVRSRGFSDEEIEGMSAEKVFNEYLIWNGIIGYGQELWDIVLDLQEASLS